MKKQMILNLLVPLVAVLALITTGWYGFAARW